MHDATAVERAVRIVGDVGVHAVLSVKQHACRLVHRRARRQPREQALAQPVQFRALKRSLRVSGARRLIRTARERNKMAESIFPPCAIWESRVDKFLLGKHSDVLMM